MSGGRGLLLGGAALVVVVAGIGAWASGMFDAPKQPAAAADVPAPAPSPNALRPELAQTVEAGRAAAAKAITAAHDAEGMAAAADKIAVQASEQAALAREAADQAEATAAKACKAPSDKLLCADASDGTHYAGGQSCKGDQGCGPEGFGVSSDRKRGWESAGQWTDWNLVLGCDSLNGKQTYCGQQAGSAWNGFGVSYNENDAQISADWAKGVGKSPMRLDYPTGSKMRGEMVTYVLSGLGLYDRADGRILAGRWDAGQLVSGTMTYVVSGTVVSGDFANGAAALGTITYADGRVFVGKIEDGPAIAEALPSEGAIFSPAGAIIQQGIWESGRLIGN